MPHTQIRPLRTHEEFRACEDVQNEVWGKVAVSAEVLLVTQEHGGAVIGALVDGELCGFIYAFLARHDGHLVHWSHLMAVRERQRDQGLGFRMKQRHRRLALERGIRSICWTYDPLQSRNAALNVGRLRAEVERYVPNCYGQFPSTIERGLPSDRFVVNWHVASGWEQKRRQAQHENTSALALPRINQAEVNSNGFLENRSIESELTHPALLVEIPGNADDMRRRASDLACRWRMETRGIFQGYLRTGYRVLDFVRDAGQGRCFYVLRRRTRASR
jgi:predicted GNAT superfamily acetyltransferase